VGHLAVGVRRRGDEGGEALAELLDRGPDTVQVGGGLQLRRSLIYCWPKAESVLYDEPKRLVRLGLATARTRALLEELAARPSAGMTDGRAPSGR
jgi:hypothetical protein